MSGTVTLSILRDRIRDRAKMQKSLFVTEPEITSLINDSIASLYDLIITHRGDEYFETEDTIVITNGTSSYSFPSDFYKLIAITNSNNVPLDTFNRREVYHTRGALKYNVSNNQLKINKTSASETLKIYYVPLAPELVDDSDTCDFYNGWEKYVIVDCAKIMLQMEESDANHLERELQVLEGRILAAAPKDTNRAGRIVDVKRSVNNALREI